MATTPRGIVTPDSGEGYDLIVDLAAMADTIDDAIDDVATDLDTAETSITALQTATGVKDYRWANTAARTAQAGMVAGDRGFQTDTLVDYWYSGSAWVANMPGLNLLIPTSVAGTGSSVSSRGVVTFTAATTSGISVNGVFSSRFANYRVLINTTTQSTTADRHLRVRASGTDLSSALYDSQEVTSNNATTTSAQRLSQTSFLLQVNTLGISGPVTLDLLGPNAAQHTFVESQSTIFAATGTTPIRENLGGRVRDTVAYDGFTFYPASGTITGTLTVCGYNE